MLALLPVIWVRFPDGRVRHGWRLVDWVSVAGTAMFALGIALRPTRIEVEFLPIPSREVAVVAPYVQSPVPIIGSGVLGVVQGAGLVLMLAAFVGSAAAIVARYRRAGGDEKLQLKWLAYSGLLIAVTFVYGAVAWYVLGQPLYLALTPLEVASVTMPIALAIAILRYRLYDIEVIINRTVVYVALTAMLAAGYTAALTFLQRFFISVSGQKSDAAYVLSAFAIVVGFSPLKDWLQHRVDRRLGGVRASAALDQFRAGVETVVSVIDAHRVVCRFLDEAVVAFDARGAAMYLGSDKPLYACGHLNGGPSIEVTMRHGGHELGRLVLAERRGHITYAERDRIALQKSADAVADALALGALFFQPAMRLRPR